MANLYPLFLSDLILAELTKLSSGWQEAAVKFNKDDFQILFLSVMLIILV